MIKADKKKKRTLRLRHKSKLSPGIKLTGKIDEDRGLTGEKKLRSVNAYEFKSSMCVMRLIYLIK